MTGALARLLSVSVDVAAWVFDRVADVAGPAGRRLTRVSEDARWLAAAMRCVP